MTLIVNMIMYKFWILMVDILENGVEEHYLMMFTAQETKCQSFSNLTAVGQVKDSTQIG